MAILVKHSGSVAPALVGAYGGGLGRRYAEQSDDAMRRIHARQMAASRGGGVVRRVRAGGKSLAQEQAEAQGLIGVGPQAGAIGGRPVDAFSPLGRWKQPRRLTEAELEEQALIRKERREAVGEQERWERGVKADEERRKAEELAKVREANPFVGRDISKWDESKKADYHELMKGWQKARATMVPGEEMAEMNRQVAARIEEIASQPDEKKPSVKLEGFGDELQEMPLNTVRQLKDGRIIKTDSTGRVDIEPAPKPEKPEKPAPPAFTPKDVVGFLKDAEKEEEERLLNNKDAVRRSPKEIKERAKQMFRDAMEIQNELMGEASGVQAGPSIVGQPVQDPESGRWFANTSDGRVMEIQAPAGAAAPSAQPVTTDGGQVVQTDPDIPSDAREWAARPQTEADFKALPAGTYYIDPDDGKLYQKP